MTKSSESAGKSNEITNEQNTLFKSVSDINEKIRNMTNQVKEMQEKMMELNLGVDDSDLNDNQCDGCTVHSTHQSKHNDTFRPSIGLKLDDIVATFKPFKGDGQSNIDKWLLHFEEQCTIFHLSEVQKYIFAKRVLKGPAKMFIEYESTAVTWRELRAELRGEFSKPINSVLIHQKLCQRRKKATESNLDYLYEMLELGSQADLDIQAILTHTINGISAPAHLKTFLYDARDLQDVKRKLSSFELQQNQYRQVNKGHGEKSWETNRKANVVQIVAINRMTRSHVRTLKGAPDVFIVMNLGTLVIAVVIKIRQKKSE